MTTFSNLRSTRARTRSAGFTLIEVLLVVAILTGLAGIVLVQGGSMISGARRRGTKALVERLKLYLEEYKRVTGYYPPDGIDFPVQNEEGTPVKGSAALHHFLTTPIKAKIMTAGIPRIVEHEAIATIQEAELTPAVEEFPGAREIKDPYDEPIHYDNTMDGEFRPQGGDVHIPPMDDEDHPPDPRTLPLDKGGVRRPNHVQSYGYDLWSYGDRGHEMIEGDDPPIAIWNLQEI